jgi:acyl-CoA thioester hydrolase
VTVPVTDPELAALLAGFPVVVSLPVQWGDMDAYRHVNNTVFFRWLESGRIAYTSGLGLKALQVETGVGPILASAGCDYRRQVTYPDTVHVGSRVTRIGRTSLAMEHAVVSEAARAVAAEGRATLVVFDYNAGTPVPVPETVRRMIRELEGKDVG